MKERPILFSAPMVLAILGGRKTQTRRKIKDTGLYAIDDRYHGSDVAQRERECLATRCPYGQPGDRLWVRETFADLLGTGIERITGDHGRYAYAADTPPGSYGDECRKDYGIKWRPSIHMPRLASRITLEITGVRVERLQEISEADALAEGIKAITKDGGQTIKYGIPDADGFPGTDDHGWAWKDWQYCRRTAYRDLWQRINGPGSWDKNPWVWVIQFNTEIKK